MVGAARVSQQPVFLLRSLYFPRRASFVTPESGEALLRFASPPFTRISLERRAPTVCKEVELPASLGGGSLTPCAGGVHTCLSVHTGAAW